MPEIQSVDKSSKSESMKRWNAMRDEYTNSWNASHLDLSNYINQKRGYFDTRPNRGQMINHQLLLDSHGTQACKTLASGLLSGMTSPSRPWFRLVLDDLAVNDVPGVREWLDSVQKRMIDLMNKSNIYSAFYSAYEELGQFGTSCFLILDDFTSGIRCRSYTAGEYFLSLDARGRVNGFARYFWMTVGQVVQEFGLESCSAQVRSHFQNNKVDVWIKINHLIEENQGRNPFMNDNQNMLYRSVYWEASNGADEFLARRGYSYFPVIATRWEVATTDQVYGFGPGWYALGNIKQLQKTTLDKLLAQEKLHNPPMQKDASVEGFVNLLPGGVTGITGSVPNSGVRPAYQIDPKLDSFIELNNHLYDQIDRDFFVNLFMMLMNIDRNQMTATEVAERQQEKIMMMGPVLYKLQEELLDPTMELIFAIMMEMGLIPPPPQEIAGMPIKVKYVSILAQAQQALGVEQINRVIGLVASYAQVAPQMLDVINWDQVPRQVAEMEGTQAKLLLNEEEVAAVRQQKAQQQQMVMAQQAAMTAESASKTTKNLADSQMGTGSALDGIMKNVPK